MMKARILVLSVSAALVAAVLATVVLYGSSPDGVGPSNGRVERQGPSQTQEQATRSAQATQTLQAWHMTLTPMRPTEIAVALTQGVPLDATTAAEEQATRAANWQVTQTAQARDFPGQTATKAAVQTMIAPTAAVQKTEVWQEHQTRQAEYAPTLTASAMEHAPTLTVAATMGVTAPTQVKPPRPTRKATATPWWTTPPTLTPIPTAVVQNTPVPPSQSGQSVCNTPWGTFPGSCN